MHGRRLAARAAILTTLTLALCALAAPAAGAAVTARGSVHEAYVLGARSGERLELLDRAGSVVARGRADRLGSRIFLELPPGAGYRVRAGSTTTKPFGVLDIGEHPPQSFYRGKRLREGLNYVTTRDGVELAMTVRLPPGKSLDDGPFPTVIEYSGYQVAAPGDLLSALVGGGDTSDPLLPATSTVVGAVIARLIDFAVVSVQMRGSGCSGGAFDLFGLPTTHDGYDAVESVAAQPWVKGGRVGMVGISFSGITQLFTAGTRPPHLAAITPMSVTDDTYRATGFPGGIQNRGFALSWITQRMDDARPAPGGGQPYARALTRAGDRHCRDNQALRLQTQDARARIREHPFRTPALFDNRSPSTWMDDIRVPTFFVGQYQDEQTGGHFVQSLSRLARNRKVWLTLQNGVHVDSLGPSTATRWIEFLKLYVAREIPRVPDTIVNLSGALYQQLASAPADPVLQSRFAHFTSVAAARRVFERDPRVRLLMDNGGGPQGPGSIGAPWELGYDAWPIRQTRPSVFFLGAGGRLASARASRQATASYLADPRARPAQTLGPRREGDAWLAQPRYDWRPVAGGRGLGWTTDALSRDVIIAGPSSFDVWLRSSARDTDLQVTISEVRPDGRETYVQNGWLRASHRRLDPRRSTVLDPFPTHRREDAAPLPRGRFELVRVPVFPVAHAFRRGSRIRVTLQAPGGDRPIWDFATIDRGRTRNTVGLGGATPSRIVLPVIRGATAKGTPLPGPTALRGQPSREYRRASNGG